MKNELTPKEKWEKKCRECPDEIFMYSPYVTGLFPKRIVEKEINNEYEVSSVLCVTKDTKNCIKDVFTLMRGRKPPFFLFIFYLRGIVVIVDLQYIEFNYVDFLDEYKKNKHKLLGRYKVISRQQFSPGVVHTDSPRDCGLELVYQGDIK